MIQSIPDKLNGILNLYKFTMTNIGGIGVVVRWTCDMALRSNLEVL